MGKRTKPFVARAHEDIPANAEVLCYPASGRVILLRKTTLSRWEHAKMRIAAERKQRIEALNPDNDAPRIDDAHGQCKIPSEALELFIEALPKFARGRAYHGCRKAGIYTLAGLRGNLWGLSKTANVGERTLAAIANAVEQLESGTGGNGNGKH